MDAMPMAGGAVMSMAWMPVCGESSLGAAAAFLAMWTGMMGTMMLPWLALALWRHRPTGGRAGGKWPPALLLVPAAGGYFLVWALLGAAVYCLGCAAMAVMLRCPTLSRALPIAVGPMVLLAGALQLTGWKARQLACCRDVSRCEAFGRGPSLPANVLTASRHGMRLGLHCSRCCGGLSVALLLSGIMSWPVMLAVAVAMNLERLVPSGQRIARIVGFLVIGAGVVVTVRGIGLR